MRIRHLFHIRKAKEKINACLLARTFHKYTRALASPLFPQELFLSRPDPLVRHFFGKSPVYATDGVYAGIAGANSCENKVLRNHRGNS